MSEARSILILDDDPLVTRLIGNILSAAGFDVHTAPDGPQGLEILDKHAENEASIDVVVSDISMPGMDGIEVLRRVRKSHPATTVVMLTGYGTVEAAVQSLREGADDFLTKPVVDAELLQAIERAYRRRLLIAPPTQREGAGANASGNILGSDARMRRVHDLIEAVAPSKTTVLMTGESGVGKSMVARAIHDRGPRRDEAYVEISCGSIPETLLESELFGHVKGAFTGAHADKVGKFLAAHKGTLFLDEINSASPGMQLKLLRVLQERRFEPVGSTETIEVDVRVLLATNQSLEKLVAEGHFRQDLYYRINVVEIDIPPLRDRTGDIALLAESFLQRFARENARQIAGFDDQAMAALMSYPFPGNVRELSNIVERAAVLARHQTIHIEDLPARVTNPDAAAQTDTTGAEWHWEGQPLADALRGPERDIIIAALDANDWNRQQTAEQLQINRTTLYKKMRAYGLMEGPDRQAG